MSDLRAMMMMSLICLWGSMAAYAEPQDLPGVVSSNREIAAMVRLLEKSRQLTCRAPDAGQVKIRSGRFEASYSCSDAKGGANVQVLSFRGIVYETAGTASSELESLFIKQSE